MKLFYAVKFEGSGNVSKPEQAVIFSVTET